MKNQSGNWSIPFAKPQPGKAKWWRRRDSNPRPQHCERCALPTELLPHIILVLYFFVVIPDVNKQILNLALCLQFLNQLLFCIPKFFRKRNMIKMRIHKTFHTRIEPIYILHSSFPYFL